jgi:hypothetical protein
MKLASSPPPPANAAEPPALLDTSMEVAPANRVNFDSATARPEAAEAGGISDAPVPTHAGAGIARPVDRPFHGAQSRGTLALVADSSEAAGRGDDGTDEAPDGVSGH